MNQKDQNPPHERLDWQLSNPKPSNPTVMPPTHNIIDAEKEGMNGKFCEKELSLMVSKAHFDNEGQL